MYNYACIHMYKDTRYIYIYNIYTITYCVNKKGPHTDNYRWYVSGGLAIELSPLNLTTGWEFSITIPMKGFKKTSFRFLPWFWGPILQKNRVYTNSPPS